MSTQVISWRTKKQGNAYRYQVIGIQHQQPIKVLAEGFERTRAIATRKAKQHSRYLKAEVRKAWDHAAVPPMFAPGRPGAAQ